MRYPDPEKEAYEDALLALACSLGKTGDPNANWVSKAGGLPDYICRVAKHIHANGHSVSTSIAMAISQIKKWIATGTAQTKARASAAISQWEKMKASTKLSMYDLNDDLELLAFANAAVDPIEFDDEELQRIANDDDSAVLSGCGCGESGENVDSDSIELAYKLGTGQRFKSLTNKLQKQGKSADSARRIAAAIGRRKYGAKKMGQMSAASRKRKSNKEPGEFDLTTPAGVKAAWRYCNENADVYSDQHHSDLKRRIKAAAAKLGVSLGSGSKEETVAYSKGESFLEAMDRIELHGIRGEAGYAFMHSPSPQVHSASNRLYETGRRRGYGVAEAQAMVQRLENTDAFRRHIAAGGGRMMRTSEGETVPIGRGAGDDVRSGGGVNRPISVPVLDLLEGADDLTANQAKARDRALKALRDGDDQKAAEILDVAIEAEPNDTLASAIEKLGFESVPSGMDHDPLDDEADIEPSSSYDLPEGSVFDQESDEFEDTQNDAQGAAEYDDDQYGDEGASVHSMDDARSAREPVDYGAQAAAEGGTLAASFLRSFSDNEIELAVRWKERDHPRHPDGRFRDSIGGGGSLPKVGSLSDRRGASSASKTSSGTVTSSGDVDRTNPEKLTPRQKKLAAQLVNTPAGTPKARELAARLDGIENRQERRATSGQETAPGIEEQKSAGERAREALKGAGKKLAKGIAGETMARSDRMEARLAKIPPRRKERAQVVLDRINKAFPQLSNEEKAQASQDAADLMKIGTPLMNTRAQGATSGQETAPEAPSRSFARRVAVQKGEPAPEFGPSEEAGPKPPDRQAVGGSLERMRAQSSLAPKRKRAKSGQDYPAIGRDARARRVAMDQAAAEGQRRRAAGTLGQRVRSTGEAERPRGAPPSRAAQSPNARATTPTSLRRKNFGAASTLGGYGVDEKASARREGADNQRIEARRRMAQQGVKAEAPFGAKPGARRSTAAQQGTTRGQSPRREDELARRFAQSLASGEKPEVSREVSDERARRFAQAQAGGEPMTRGQTRGQESREDQLARRFAQALSEGSKPEVSREVSDERARKFARAQAGGEPMTRGQTRGQGTGFSEESATPEQKKILQNADVAGTRARLGARGAASRDMVSDEQIQQRLAAVEAEGSPDAAGTPEDPIAVGDDLDKAVQLLAEGKSIRLDKTDAVGTLLDKLAANVEDAKAKGEKAPNYDLCKVSVPGTNLFCAESKGVPRAKMPQLSGTARPGSRADKLEKDDKGEVNITEDFAAALKRQGISQTPKTVKAASLKATQENLDGPKVAGMSKAMKAGKIPDKGIFVTRDGYIIDGHHRWASKVAIDAEDGELGDIEMPVIEVDMDIGQAIDFSNFFAAAYGIQQKGLGADAEGVGGSKTRGQSKRGRGFDFGSSGELDEFGSLSRTQKTTYARERQAGTTHSEAMSRSRGMKLQTDPRTRMARERLRQQSARQAGSTPQRTTRPRSNTRGQATKAGQAGSREDELARRFAQALSTGSKPETSSKVSDERARQFAQAQAGGAPVRRRSTSGQETAPSREDDLARRFAQALSEGSKPETAPEVGDDRARRFAQMLAGGAPVERRSTSGQESREDELARRFAEALSVGAKPEVAPEVSDERARRFAQSLAGGAPMTRGQTRGQERKTPEQVLADALAAFEQANKAQQAKLRKKKKFRDNARRLGSRVQV